jgi:hypothetical protein
LLLALTLISSIPADLYALLTKESLCFALLVLCGKYKYEKHKALFSAAEINFKNALSQAI